MDTFIGLKGATRRTAHFLIPSGAKLLEHEMNLFKCTCLYTIVRLVKTCWTTGGEHVGNACYKCDWRLTRLKPSPVINSTQTSRMCGGEATVSCHRRRICFLI